MDHINNALHLGGSKLKNRGMVAADNSRLDKANALVDEWACH